jgi:hypothetical protein
LDVFGGCFASVAEGKPWVSGSIHLISPQKLQPPCWDRVIPGFSGNISGNPWGIGAFPVQYYIWLVVTGILWNFMTFHSVGNVIIPTGELHHFSEGWLNHQPGSNL